MKNSILILITVVFFSCTSEKNEILTPVPFNEVELQDDFWLPRMQTQKETLVPFAINKVQHALSDLRRAGEYLRGERDGEQFKGRTRASDLYKVMEGISYLLMLEKDDELIFRMDSMIDIIAAAQQEDGYLYVPHIMGDYPEYDSIGPGRIGNRPYAFVEGSHELYNVGHMYEAAVAYYRATGKSKLLKVAEKNARHLYHVFFEGDPDYNNGEPVKQAPGHQEIELALAKMYRLTSDTLYLNLARKLLDVRGVTYIPEGEGIWAATYTQQHKPVREQYQAVGHAVRAGYMYSGMADVGVLSGDDSYNMALDSIWHDIVDKKMHIIGGLGAVRGIEGFGPPYELPNKEAYDETCAAVANVFFNFRMFLLHRDAKYMDVAEVSLLNNALAGVNLEGNRFFYVNPLEADGDYAFNHGDTGRSPWFNVACCPSNIARLIPQVPGMMYSWVDNTIYLSFYGSSQTAIPLSSGNVEITQVADYPFDGTIRVKVYPDTPKRFSLRMRIPQWVSSQFVPGELYQYINQTDESWTLKVNGVEIHPDVRKGFAVIDRKWEDGDEIVLYLPMPVRLNKAHPAVKADEGKLALTRGPLVMCAEGIDQDQELERFRIRKEINRNDIIAGRFNEGVMEGIVKLSVPAVLNNGEEGQLNLIPYYAWNNRGDGKMKLWIPLN